MVLELLAAWNLVMNDFFGQHIILISHVLAAVFLILSEDTMNMRIITPILDAMEDKVFGSIPLIPNIVTTAIFIVWATFSIFLYQFLFTFILDKYEDSLTTALIISFFLIMFAVNFKYRD